MDDALDKQTVKKRSLPTPKKHLVCKKKKSLGFEEDKENSSGSSRSRPSVKENIGGSSKCHGNRCKGNFSKRKRILKKLESLLPPQSSNCEVRSASQIVKESISATCQMEDEIEEVLAEKRAEIGNTDASAKLTLNHVRSSFLSALQSTEDLAFQGQDEDRELLIENYMSDACDDFFNSLANEACYQASLFSPPNWQLSENIGSDEDDVLLSDNDSVVFQFGDNPAANSREGSIEDQSEIVPWQPSQALSTPIQNKKRLNENCGTPTPFSKPKKPKMQVIPSCAQASFTPSWQDCSPSPVVLNIKSPVSKKRLKYPNTALTPNKESSQPHEDITSNLHDLINGQRKLKIKRKLYSSSDEYSSQETDLADNEFGPRCKNLSQTDSVDLFVSPVEPLNKESQREEPTLDDSTESEVSVKCNLGNPLKQHQGYFRKLADGENFSQDQELFCHSTPTETGQQFCKNGNFDSEPVSSKESSDGPLVKITPYHYYSLQYNCGNSVFWKDTKSFKLENNGLFNYLNEDCKTKAASSSPEFCKNLPNTPKYVVKSRSGIRSIEGYFAGDHSLREESTRIDDFTPPKKTGFGFFKFHNHIPCFHEPAYSCVSFHNSANVPHICMMSSVPSNSQSSVSTKKARIFLTKKSENHVLRYSLSNEESSFESFDSQSSSAPSSVLDSIKRIILTPTQNRSMLECRAQNNVNNMQEDLFITPVGQNIICSQKGAPVKIQKRSSAAYEPSCKRSLAGEFFKISLDTPPRSPLPLMEEAIIAEESDGTY